MRLTILILAAGVLASCAADKPKFKLTPSARVVGHFSSFGIYSLCDRQNLVYLSDEAILAVVPHGCPDGFP